MVETRKTALRGAMCRAALIAAFASSFAHAAPFLVKNINPTTYPPPDYPLDLIEVNGILFFSATDAVNGTELWKSDGTAAGTVLVKDVSPGPVSGVVLRERAANDGTLYFIAHEFTEDAALWERHARLEDRPFHPRHVEHGRRPGRRPPVARARTSSGPKLLKRLGESGQPMAITQDARPFRSAGGARIHVRCAGRSANHFPA